MERGRPGSERCSPLRGLPTVPSLKPPAGSCPGPATSYPRLPGPIPPRPRLLYIPAARRASCRQGDAYTLAARLPSPPCSPPASCTRVRVRMCVRSPACQAQDRSARVWLCQAVCLHVHTCDSARGTHRAGEGLLPEAASSS